jgi:hypothetical protein
LLAIEIATFRSTVEFALALIAGIRTPHEAVRPQKRPFRARAPAMSVDVMLSRVARSLARR